MPMSPCCAPDSASNPSDNPPSSHSYSTSARPRYWFVSHAFRQEFAQVQITALILDEQEQTRGLVAIRWIGDPDVAAGNGLHALAARFLVEPDEAECIAEIGQRERALAVLGCGLDDVVKAHDAVGNREFGVNTKMDKAGI